MVQQLAPELALEIAEPGVSAVVFVDTRADTPGDVEVGAVEGVTVTPLAPPDAATPSLGHHFQPDVLLAYAALLLEGRQAPPAWLVTVPGMAFGHGEGLSQTASAAIEAAFHDETQPLPRLMARLAEFGHSRKTGIQSAERWIPVFTGMTKWLNRVSHQRIGRMMVHGRPGVTDD